LVLGQTAPLFNATGHPGRGFSVWAFAAVISDSLVNPSPD